MKNFISETKITLVQAGLADGQTDPNSESVDMSGFESCCFIGSVGTITGTGTVTLQAQRSTDNSNWSDITGASDVASGSADSDKTLMVNVVKGGYRYLRTTLTRGTANSIYGGTLAVQYDGTSFPTTQPAAAVTGGTAGTPVSKTGGEVAV